MTNQWTMRSAASPEPAEQCCYRRGFCSDLWATQHIVRMPSAIINTVLFYAQATCAEACCRPGIHTQTSCPQIFFLVLLSFLPYFGLWKQTPRQGFKGKLLIVSNWGAMPLGALGHQEVQEPQSGPTRVGEGGRVSTSSFIRHGLCCSLRCSFPTLPACCVRG